eukprot:c8132_g1_i1.p1 GENE.c8132_g1_i1~~c8132_g1_i1.p1  ORF type:complete len:106 (-),score=8.35 c8132_g1_i1:80-397(-)
MWAVKLRLEALCITDASHISMLGEVLKREVSDLLAIVRQGFRIITTLLNKTNEDFSAVRLMLQESNGGAVSPETDLQKVLTSPSPSTVKVFSLTFLSMKCVMCHV